MQQIFDQDPEIWNIYNALASHRPYLASWNDSRQSTFRTAVRLRKAGFSVDLRNTNFELASFLVHWDIDHLHLYTNQDVELEFGCRSPPQVLSRHNPDRDGGGPSTMPTQLVLGMDVEHFFF